MHASKDSMWWWIWKILQNWLETKQGLYYRMSMGLDRLHLQRLMLELRQPIPLVRSKQCCRHRRKRTTAGADWLGEKAAVHFFLKKVEPTKYYISGKTTTCPHPMKLVRRVNINTTISCMHEGPHYAKTTPRQHQRNDQTQQHVPL